MGTVKGPGLGSVQVSTARRTSWAMLELAVLGTGWVSDTHLMLW